jgi:Coenzyme PQQ synthesis protein D (PqqD)
MKPTRRTEGLVVVELMGEVLVYDRERNRAHSLNPPAAAVFRNCDGTKDVDDLARLLASELGAPVEPDCVWLALDRLGKARLLQERVRRPPEAGRLSRRELVRRVGIGILLPVVTSIVAPTPVQAAASCVSNCASQPFGTPCSSTAPSNCFCTCDGSGNCIGGC